MSQVEFEENVIPSKSNIQNIRTGSRIVDWLIKKNIFKTKETASLALFFIGILFFLLSIYFFVFGFNLPSKRVQIYEGDISELEL